MKITPEDVKRLDEFINAFGDEEESDGALMENVSYDIVPIIKGILSNTMHDPQYYLFEIAELVEEIGGSEVEVKVAEILRKAFYEVEQLVMMGTGELNHNEDEHDR